MIKHTEPIILVLPSATGTLILISPGVIMNIFVILAQLMLVCFIDFCDILDHSSHPITSHKHLI